MVLEESEVTDDEVEVKPAAAAPVAAPGSLSTTSPAPKVKPKQASIMGFFAKKSKDS
jgi:hypothetical protein